MIRGYDSCGPDVESCCGQRYVGKLTITVKSISKTLNVHQWHGLIGPGHR